MAGQSRRALSPPEGLFGPNAKHDVIPEPDRPYVLWNRDTGDVLCLDGGELVTRSPDVLSPIETSWVWICVQRDGWLALKNIISGGYIRVDGKWVVADSQEFGQTARFTYRLSEEGGLRLVYQDQHSAACAVSEDPLKDAMLAVHLKRFNSYHMGISWIFVGVNITEGWFRPVKQEE